MELMEKDQQVVQKARNQGSVPEREHGGSMDHIGGCMNHVGDHQAWSLGLRFTLRSYQPLTSIGEELGAWKCAETIRGHRIGYPWLFGARVRQREGGVDKGGPGRAVSPPPPPCALKSPLWLLYRRDRGMVVTLVRPTLPLGIS